MIDKCFINQRSCTMKGKLLLISVLTAIALNAYATEVKVLKHTEQAAPHTKLTLTTLKNNVDPRLKLKLYAAHSVRTEQLVNATSKLDSISLRPEFNATVIKGHTMYMIWNMSQVAHTYTIGRNVCISAKNDETPIGNCSYVDDEIYVKPNDIAYLNSEIQANQELTAGQSYFVTVGITVQDENSTEIFISDDGQDYTPTNKSSN